MPSSTKPWRRAKRVFALLALTMLLLSLDAPCALRYAWPNGKYAACQGVWIGDGFAGYSSEAHLPAGLSVGPRPYGDYFIDPPWFGSRSTQTELWGLVNTHTVALTIPLFIFATCAAACRFVEKRRRATPADTTVSQDAMPGSASRRAIIRRRTKKVIYAGAALSLLFCLHGSCAVRYCYNHDQVICIGDGGCGYSNHMPYVAEGFSLGGRNDIGSGRFWIGTGIGGFGSRSCGFSAYVPLIIFGLPAFFFWRHDHKHRHQSGCCNHCGYNLTGNASGRCPECGLTINAAGVAYLPFALPRPLTWLLTWSSLSIAFIAAFSYFLMGSYSTTNVRTALCEGKIIVYVTDSNLQLTPGWRREQSVDESYMKSEFWLGENTIVRHEYMFNDWSGASTTWQYVHVVYLWRIFLILALPALAMLYLQRRRHKYMNAPINDAQKPPA